MLNLSTIQHLLIYPLSTYYTNIAYIKDYVDFSIFYGLFQITVQSLSKNFHWTAKTSYGSRTIAPWTIAPPDNCPHPPIFLFYFYLFFITFFF